MSSFYGKLNYWKIKERNKHQRKKEAQVPLINCSNFSTVILIFHLFSMTLDCLYKSPMRNFKSLQKNELFGHYMLEFSLHFSPTL